MRRNLFILLLVSVLPLLSLLTPGLPVTHDGQDHVARIANFYQNITEGTLIPRWAGNLNWGYGHPVMMFLYPLPSYIASLFHAIGFSLVDSVKLVFATAFIASVFAMYAWGALQWGATGGVVAAVLYGFAPYRLVDLYVRGAIGEHVAFVFPPLILWGLLALARGQKRYAMWIAVVAASTAGLLLSHNAISLMMLPVIAVYALYVMRWEAKNRPYYILQAVGSLALGFGVAAFFWVPALLEGKYTLRDIVTAGEFVTRFAPLSQLLYTTWNYGGSDTLPKYLGFAQLIGLIGALFVLFRSKIEKKKRLLGWGLVATIVVAAFLMTGASAVVWNAVTLLQKFQFPWRLLSVSVLASAALAAWWGRRALLLCVLAVLFTLPMWHPKSYSVQPDSLYTGVYQGTTDTGESSPIWSVRFMETAPAAPAEGIEGQADITPTTRTHTKHIYTVNAQIRTRIRENTLYFPGWQVLVDGAPVEVEFQDPANRGLMTYWVEPGTHTVAVVFGETKLRMFAKYLSLVSLGVLGVLGTMALWKKRR
jgi:uncharacterized membrane protein